MSVKAFQKAKTAYGLLGTVIKLIQEDPRRMQMGAWLTSLSSVPIELRPECGTIGCVGGWIDTLTERESYRNAARTLGFCTQTDALGGRAFSDEGYLADTRAIDELFFNDRLCGDPQQGTRRHAAKVVTAIKKFRKTHRARLYATKVTYGEAAQ